MALPNISELNSELDELQQKLSKPGELSPTQMAKLSKKYHKLSEIQQLIAEQKRISTELDELKSIADESMATLVEEERLELTAQLEKTTNKLEQLTMEPLPDDESVSIIEFRAGTGGTEASMFAEELLRMYTRYATAQKWPVEVIEKTVDQAGGIKSAMIKINSTDSFGLLRFESGVHRVQRVPSTESSGRIHTSAASVVVIPEPEDIEVVIRDEDVKVDVYRSSGPGGQSVNTTDSAVRITHIPTNIVVTCQDGKSQLKNKQKAMTILAAKLYDIERQQQYAEQDELRRTSIKSGDRSAKIRTYNFPQSRITDHRVKNSWHNLTEVLDGNLEEIIASVQKFFRAG